MKITTLLATVILLLAGYITLDRYSSTSEIAPEAAMSGSTEDSVSRLEALERELAAMKAERAAEATQRADQMASSHSANYRSMTLAPPKSEEVQAAPSERQVRDAAEGNRAEEQFQLHVAEIAAIFERELRDQKWADGTRDSIEATLARGELTQVKLKSIDCRTSTCRLEIQEDIHNKLSTLLPLLALQLADKLPNVTAQRLDQGDGRATMVLFMSR